MTTTKNEKACGRDEHTTDWRDQTDRYTECVWSAGLLQQACSMPHDSSYIWGDSIEKKKKREQEKEETVWVWGGDCERITWMLEKTDI